MRIEPRLLRKLRERKGWSRADLAERAKITARTIQRLESDDAAPTTTRQSTLDALTKALGCTAEVLCGQEPLPEPESEDGPNDCGTTQLNKRVQRSSCNALWLVARRYGVKPSEIVDLAPLLFLLAAESSLTRRKKILNDYWDLHKRQEQLGDQLGHLILHGIYNVEQDLDDEGESIDKLDIFGRRISNESKNWDEPNPFVAWISDAIKEIGLNKGPDTIRISARRPDGERLSYSVVTEELKRLFGEDTEAIQFILDGEALLHELPDELSREDIDPAQRAAWVREKSREFKPEFYELFDGL